MATTLDETNDEELFAMLREDHWTMAVLFQRLSEGLTHGLDEDVLRRILASLTVFFAEHCEREEFYLARRDHPEQETHRLEHRQVLDQIRAIQARCDGGGPIATADIAAISAMFTEVLFPADRRDGLPAPGGRARGPHQSTS